MSGSLDSILPFACRSESPAGDAGERSDDPLDRLDGKRVTRCALSRICGGCGLSLGRPIAFAGPQVEVARNAFHFPPLHVACAHELVAHLPGPAREWQIVTTAGFEFVRAAKEDLDRRPTFQPNSVLG